MLEKGDLASIEDSLLCHGPHSHSQEGCNCSLLPSKGERATEIAVLWTYTTEAKQPKGQAMLHSQWPSTQGTSHSLVSFVMSYSSCRGWPRVTSHSLQGGSHLMTGLGYREHANTPQNTLVTNTHFIVLSVLSGLR